MNITTNIPDTKALQARANMKFKEEERQTKAVEAAVTVLLKEIEDEANKFLAGLTYTLAANVHYDLDRQTQCFSVTLLVESQYPDMHKVKERLRAWSWKKTFPFKIPNLTSRQDTLGAIDLKDGEDDKLPSGQVGLAFVFVEW